MGKQIFKILPAELFDSYSSQVSISKLERYEKLEESELSIDNFSFYTSVSAVFSSKIEGEGIELDSYIKHKRFGIEFLPDYTQKIDDLYNAYHFAKSAKFNEENVLTVHQILTKHILPQNKRGKIRTGQMYVTTTDGKIEYVAASPYSIKPELEKFYSDLAILMNNKLSILETFFFASLLHLVYVKIHPFDDGNGRVSRLIEKWFLAEKLGYKAWLIQSDKNYYLQHHKYYECIRHLGLEYAELDYSKSLPFLLILPQSLDIDDSKMD